jgi:hypothetical protein
MAPRDALARQRRQPTPSAGPADPRRSVNRLELGMHTVTEFGEWIRNADTKAALLAALLGLALTGLMGQGDALRQTLHGHSFWTLVALVLLVASCGTGILSAAALIGMQMPRLPVPSGGSRFAFPSIARGPVTALLTELDDDQVTAEIWSQAHVLARIAMAKFRLLRFALVCAAITLATFVAWRLVILGAS